MMAAEDTASDVNVLLESLPEEQKTMVKVITEMISTKLSQKILDIQREVKEKDKEINLLKNDVAALRCRVDELELHLDGVD